MSMVRPAPLRVRNYLLLIAVLLACVVYAWQVVNTWDTQDAAGQEEARIGLQGVLAGHNPDSLELKGTGVASSASATLYFYNRGVFGVLQLRDMPVLPSSQVYQMWCVDAEGDIDASSVFRVPVDSQEFTIVDVSTRRIVSQYNRVFVTIEPASGSEAPSAQIVLVHEQ